ncbi:MAG TPA: hypothetical protein DDZ41_05585 [Flavobacterium sp.]|nr:hypothetical protein [Flavobacterium sp.]
MTKGVQKYNYLLYFQTSIVLLSVLQMNKLYKNSFVKIYILFSKVVLYQIIFLKSSFFKLIFLIFVLVCVLFFLAYKKHFFDIAFVFNVKFYNEQ